MFLQGFFPLIIVGLALYGAYRFLKSNGLITITDDIKKTDANPLILQKMRELDVLKAQLSDFKQRDAENDELETINKLIADAEKEVNALKQSVIASSSDKAK